MSILSDQFELLQNVTAKLCEQLKKDEAEGGKLSFEVYQPGLKNAAQRGHISFSTLKGEVSVINMALGLINDFADASLNLDGVGKHIIAHEAENQAAIRLGLFEPVAETSEASGEIAEPVCV